MSHKFPHLFSSLTVNKTELSNRLVMGSMHTGLEDSKDGLIKLRRFYQDRARGGVGLIVTGGFAPNRQGWLVPFSGKLTQQREALLHQDIPQAVHDEGGKILLQVLHAGRYSYHPFAAAPSGVKSPISKFKPWQMSEKNIFSTIHDFVRCAELAKLAGYDGVEIMGSEGYLINQFIAEHTNKRSDDWGGSFAKRIRFPLEIVRAIRQRLGPDFILMFRISLLDLVEQGSTFSETLALAKLLQLEGVSIFNSGIGWHEARVPTIATLVPRGAFVWATRELKKQVSVPVVAVNRINTPELAEQILARGEADLISMARPFLADAEFAIKAKSGRSLEINTCIACNQGCLDLVFKNQRATCLVNPRACYEAEFELTPAKTVKRIAIVGAGPAGLSCALTCAERGHRVTLYEQGKEIGGQFNLARNVPGKSEFNETLRYFKVKLQQAKVDQRLGSAVTMTELLDGKFDEVVIATGTQARQVQIPSLGDLASLPQLIPYSEVLKGNIKLGDTVAIIGAGGIGFDVARYLTQSEVVFAAEPEREISQFLDRWGVDTQMNSVGGLKPNMKTLTKQGAKRQVFLMQRKSGRLGAGLGKTTGWIHRAELQKAGVEFIADVKYQKIDQQGLHILVGETARILPVKQIIICAGQESQQSLYLELQKTGLVSDSQLHLIGGAFKAGELDAKQAILEGFQLGRRL